MTRTLIRPTGFVDSPFGHDGKVARLAGGLNWFGLVELLRIDGNRRTAGEIVPVAGIEDRFDAAMAADWARITGQRKALQMGERTIRLDQPQVMGIVNATPDSFSDGGAYADASGAADAGAVMAAAGAAIIDIGGESTRPGATTVWENDEIERVLPIVQRLAAGGHAVSIDTRKSGVMSAALGAGAKLVNDVSALTWDPQSAKVVAEAGAPVVLMHHQGDPTTMQDAPRYDDALVEVFLWLEERIAAAEETGIPRDRILVDPGIGFGKTVAHNLELMNGLALLHGLGCPIVLGASRKRMIGALANEAPADKRLPGSLALALKGVEQGAQILRVHDIPETVQALKVWRGLRDAALTPKSV
ncbi:dihydropteroate synthase [Sphingomonas sp. NSE70-1]|uniref:dihydropteroate synthase n=1 Tax=Sphingomonas caseinilyticus TaxID=2908205 RepID=A0ABT0RQP9_9SPHN|nr:dihydropteroate synthase [Sphingomonas caseinilyticus]MCL6697342.1 dihydropteroate synthase [Sphingomonas caseinilyticus]